MSVLTATFRLVDEMSEKLDSMAQSGQEIINKFQSLEDSSNAAFDGIEKGVTTATESVDGVAKSLDDYSDSAEASGKATDELTAAIEACDSAATAGAAEIASLEEAEKGAAQSADSLTEANKKATEATEELGKATEKTSEETEEAGKKGVDAVQSIASALAAAGIVKTVTEIAQAVYEMAEAFDEAEKIIVNATGATGAALEDLERSMLRAYAANDDALTDVAGAVGEISTRMGLTGDELTEVTGLFLDFADVTGGNVVSSVQNVTKVMNRWGIEGTNVEGVMDKLVYAAQSSGISVDTLSNTLITGAASFQNAGLSIDNVINMLADFEIAGINGVTAITAMRTAVSNFAKDGIDAQTGILSTIDAIAQMEDTTEAAAVASEVFGRKAGQDLAKAIMEGQISVETFSATLDEASGALQRTAEAGESLEEKWQKANNSIQTAFTQALEPTINKLSSGLADVTHSMGEFLIEHPAVAKAITALGVGVGALAVGIAGVSFATNVAIPAIVKLGTTINTTMPYLYIIAAAVAGVTAAVLFLSDAFEENMGETEGMTAATRAQYYELQNLNAEYERAVETYGDTSEQASRLKYQVDDLTAAFEANRQTMEELQAEVDALCEGTEKIAKSYHEAKNEIHNNEIGTLALISKYEDLANATELTEGQQIQMEAIAKRLAQQYPEVADAIGDITGNSDEWVAALKRVTAAEAEQENFVKAQEAYADAVAKSAELDEEILKLEQNINFERDRLSEKSWFELAFAPGRMDDIKAYKAELEELQIAQATNDAFMAELAQDFEGIADAANNAGDAMLSYEQAAALAFQEVQADINALCQAYDEAYQAAYESFSGQFGLFDEAAANMDATVENAQRALDSQLAYWDNYLSNVNVLKDTSYEDLGITQENYEMLMSYAQNGSEEAAGFAQSMVDAITSGDQEAVAHLANTLAEVEAKKQEAAAGIAEWQTDFENEMQEILNVMEETVDGMNLDTEAADSAKATIDAYIRGIREGEDGAVRAAENIAKQVAATLTANPVSLRVNVQQTATTLRGHAKGTTSAESIFIAGEEGPELIARKAAAYASGTTDSTDFFIAGEHGPELIIGEQGSTVFPTEETDRLINALSSRQPLEVFPAAIDGAGNDRRSVEGTEKRIVIEIVGSGEIEASGGNKESVLEVLTKNIKPVLMQIIQEEIYEEGDLSYEY